MCRSYVIRRAEATPVFDGAWEGPAWRGVEAVGVDLFHSAGSGHEPKTQVKVCYDDTGLYVIFRVSDRYVRSIRVDHKACVCADACVEFFVRPKRDRGYFNFEMNCGGTLYLSYVEDPARTPDGLAKATHVPDRVLDGLPVYHSMPRIVYPEVEEEVTWVVEYKAPFSLLEEYVGELGDVAGQEWRGNFYKCAEDNSHPHWASWAPIGEALNFHVPEHFAALVMEA